MLVINLGLERKQMRHVSPLPNPRSRRLIRTAYGTWGITPLTTNKRPLFSFIGTSGWVGLINRLLTLPLPVAVRALCGPHSDG